MDELRWQPPQPVGCLEGTLDASQFGPFCPQLHPKTGEFVGSEACLTLNVWTAGEATPGDDRPVMVFVHGGGNIQGGSAVEVAQGQPLYSGRHLVEMAGVVVVTINYRLGALGFLALPELAGEAEMGVAGNYAILDQVAALEWVQKNIAAFGGNPDQVLLFGESAGALNTCTLTMSPLATGLIHGAISESGMCRGVMMAQALPAYDQWVDEQLPGCAGETRLDCLRQLSAQEVLAALPGGVGVASLSFGFKPQQFGPLVDGLVIPNHPGLLVKAGNYNQVPYMLGTSAEEYASLLSVPIQTKQGYETLVSNMFSALGQEVVEAMLEAYPVEAYDSPRAAAIDLLSDGVFTCPHRTWARALAQAQQAPVYRYFFSRRPETMQGEQPAAHALELLYVFGTMHDIPLYNPAEGDSYVSQQMMGYWTRFAAGDPNADGAVLWPQYDVETDPYLEFNHPVVAKEGLHTDKCDLWESLYE